MAARGGQTVHCATVISLLAVERKPLNYYFRFWRLLSNIVLAGSMLDQMDLKILKILQEDCTLPVAEIGKMVGLSTTPCWRRIQRLEQEGVIERRVALLSPLKVGAGVTVFVAITTTQHNPGWLERFHAVVQNFPEVVEAYRMSGQVDYLLRVVVPDIASYDRFYKSFIAQIELTDVSSSFAMEQIKFTTALPLHFSAESAPKRLATMPDKV
jgi:Lrp/AsnC family transcriptional regulator